MKYAMQIMHVTCCSGVLGPPVHNTHKQCSHKHTQLTNIHSSQTMLSQTYTAHKQCSHKQCSHKQCSHKQFSHKQCSHKQCSHKQCSASIWSHIHNTCRAFKSYFPTHTLHLYADLHIKDCPIARASNSFVQACRIL